jgi:hypothetical protein
VNNIPVGIPLGDLMRQYYSLMLPMWNRKFPGLPIEQFNPVFRYILDWTDLSLEDGAYPYFDRFCFKPKGVKKEMKFEPPKKPFTIGLIVDLENWSLIQECEENGWTATEVNILWFFDRLV